MNYYLKKADLVTETKFKNFIYYELNTSVFEDLMAWFSQFGVAFKGDKNEK